MSITWWVFGIGWIGSQPGWNVLQVATNPAVVPTEEVQQLSAYGLEGLPPDWIVVDEADVRSAADSHVVCNDADPRRLLAVNSCIFSAATDYFTHRVVVTGGERYRPLGIPDNVITQYFFRVVDGPTTRSCRSSRSRRSQTSTRTGSTKRTRSSCHKPRLTTTRRCTRSWMVRNHGSIRLRPALLSIFSALLFGLGCYHLHRRDQAIWAVREAAGQ